MITDWLAVRDSTDSPQSRAGRGLIAGHGSGLSSCTGAGQGGCHHRQTLDISAADVQAQLPTLRIHRWLSWADVFSKSEVLLHSHASGKVIGEILRRQGQIQALPAIDDTYDARFVTALQANPGDLK